MSMHPRFKILGVNCPKCSTGIFIINKFVKDQHGETRMLFDCINCGHHFVGQGKLAGIEIEVNE